jgi:hypothetical protein
MFEPGIGTQGSNASGLAEQPIPGITTGVDDLASSLEHAVRQAIISEMQPQPLDRVEFGRIGRQEDHAEVFGHDEIARGMPAGLVHQHNAMRPWRDGLSEFSKEEVHRGGIEPGHHQSDTGVAGRAYGPDDPSRLVADIAQPARGIAALPPDIAGPPFLSNPRLVLAPDFKALGFWMSLRDFR